MDGLCVCVRDVVCGCSFLCVVNVFIYNVCSCLLLLLCSSFIFQVSK